MSFAQHDEGAILPEGYHKGKIKKVLCANKDGNDYRTKKGDQYVLAVFECDEGEGLINLIVEGAGAFTTVRFFKRVFGMTGADMDAKGITKEKLIDDAWHRRATVGRDCWMYCTHKMGRANLEPVDPADVPATALKKGAEGFTASIATVSEDDLPF